MNKKDQLKHSEDYIETILESPQHYKICLICKMIIDSDLSSCPHCYGYRFETGAEAVANHVLTMANQNKTGICLDERYED